MKNELPLRKDADGGYRSRDGKFLFKPAQLHHRTARVLSWGAYDAESGLLITFAKTLHSVVWTAAHSSPERWAGHRYPTLNLTVSEQS